MKWILIIKQYWSIIPLVFGVMGLVYLLATSLSDGKISKEEREQLIQSVKDLG